MQNQIYQRLAQTISSCITQINKLTERAVLRLIEYICTYVI